MLAQQAAYQYLPGPQRRRLHHRALEALQAQQPPPLVQIAHHTLALGNRDAWLPQAQAAADQAVELGDHGTAAALLHQILDTPELQPEPRSRAALTLARIAVNGVDLAGNAAALRRILADPHLPATTRGDIRLSLGLLMVNHGSDRTGHGEIERAVRELRHCPERAARGMVALAMNERGDSADQAWTWLERAEETVRDGPYEAMRATVRATRLSLLAREADPDVWPFLDDLPRRADDPEVLRQTARALYNVGELAVETGHDRRGRALLTEAQALARDAGIPHLECYSRIALLRLDGLAGHWAELERDFALLIDEYPDIGMAREERALAGARLAIARGRQARALEWLQEAADFGARGTQVTVSCRAAAETAALRLAQDAPAAAWGAALAAVTDLRGARAWPRATGLLPVAVESALACADRDAAEQLADEAEQQLKGRDAPGATAELHCARGLLLEAADPAGPPSSSPTPGATGTRSAAPTRAPARPSARAGRWPEAGRRSPRSPWARRSAPSNTSAPRRTRPAASGRCASWACAPRRPEGVAVTAASSRPANSRWRNCSRGARPTATSRKRCSCPRGPSSSTSPTS
ncbi:hypothetical protein ACFQZC_26860 [Streptacidiphilus monticola]